MTEMKRPPGFPPRKSGNPAGNLAKDTEHVVHATRAIRGGRNVMGSMVEISLSARLQTQACATCRS